MFGHRDTVRFRRREAEIFDSIRIQSIENNVTTTALFFTHNLELSKLAASDNVLLR